MKLSLVPLKLINNIYYSMLRLRRANHYSLVSANIEKLFNYHSKGEKFDFSEVRRQLLKDILLYARRNTGYYKKILPRAERIHSITNTSFRKIPFLTKDIIRENSSALISDIVPQNCLSQLKTAGSTGEPLAFWSSGNTDDLHQKFLFEIFGYKPGDKILALDGTLIEDALTEKDVFWKTKSNENMLPYGGMALSSLYLTQKTLPAYVSFILSYKPQFIRGYPAFITEIAQYMVNNSIRVNFKIKGIELTSELCLSNQVSIISQAFNTKVFGQYGHTEASVFGYTLDDSFEYYCSPLYGFTEVINDNGQHVAIGEEGEIVVTCFSNFGMPFIRYRTSDRAIYGGEENGIVKLLKVLGRTADFVLTDTNEKISLTALVFGQHYEALKSIAQWQIVQNKIGEVTVNIQKLPGFSQHDEDEIGATFLKVANIKCEFVYNQEFIKSKAGKVRFVVQNVNE